MNAKKKHPPALVKAWKMLYSIFKQAKKAPTDQSSTFKALTNETTSF